MTNRTTSEPWSARAAYLLYTFSKSKPANVMPYCNNCGQEYKPDKKSCKSCGASLSPTASSFTTDDINNDPDIKKHRKLRRSQANVERSNASLEFFACCIGIAVILLGLSLLSPDEIEYFINGNIGILYIGGAIIAILMKLVIDRRIGYSIARSLIETVLIGGVTYLLIYGVFWYIETNFIQTDHPLFTSSTPLVGLGGLALRLTEVSRREL